MIKEAKFVVTHLRGNARLLTEALHNLGILCSVNVNENTVTVHYDPNQYFFVEVMEIIEGQGCQIMSLNHTATLGQVGLVS